MSGEAICHWEACPHGANCFHATAPEPREDDYEPDVPVKAHCIHMLDCGCRPPLPEPREDVAVAEVLAAHEADVTSYDAGDLWGCRCGWELTASQRSHDYDGDKWADYRAHVAVALAPLIAERVRAAEERGERWGLQFAIGVLHGSVGANRDPNTQEQHTLDLLRARRDRADRRAER